MFSSLETSPQAIQLNSSSTPKAFNLEDLDADTEQEEEHEEGEMTLREAQEIIMRHTLPKAVSRKNNQLPEYVPEGRLFGAFTTRGEGITQATYRYPKVVQAIHHLASLRGGEASCEGYLSAQVNRAKRMQVHKDKNNHSTSWLIALGDFTGGRLWLEDPLGQHQVKQRRRTYGWTHLLLINNKGSPTHLLRRRRFCKNGAVESMCHYQQTLSMCQMGPSNLCHLRRKRSSENISTLGM